MICHYLGIYIQDLKLLILTYFFEKRARNIPPYDKPIPSKYIEMFQ